jgi:hypothetical protein
MTHEESCRYHREVHAPRGKQVLGGRGLERYIGYYADQAFSMAGVELPELPWDRVVLEWLTEELWKEMWVWRKTDPEGIKLAEDEKVYGDGKTGMMLLYEENVIVDSEGDGSGVNLIFLIMKRSNISHEEFVKYHREVHAPLMTSVFGSRLNRYIANYVNEGLSVTDGLMSNRPYDAIVIARFDKETWKSMDAWRKTSEGMKITEDEDNFMDRKSGIVLVCQEYKYIG